MLIVILVICIAILFLACFIGDRLDEDSHLSNFCCGSLVVGLILGAICVIMIPISVGKLSGYSVIDEKIQLYEDANAAIEEHINNTVEDYKVYENDTLDRFDGSNGTEIVSLYPELKANELIQEQMEIYYQNQTIILNLKEEKINSKPWRWWLYFGG